MIKELEDLNEILIDLGMALYYMTKEPLPIWKKKFLEDGFEKLKGYVREKLPLETDLEGEYAIKNRVDGELWIVKTLKSRTKPVEK